jgi:putative two-component system response regulator
MAGEIAHDHHEWYDGAGYPRGLAGGEIPLSARIVAVADVYDAMTTTRVYKPAKSHDETRAAIQEGSGTHFDSAIVEAFLRCDMEFERTATELADDIDAQAPRVRTDQEVRALLALAV